MPIANGKDAIGGVRIRGPLRFCVLRATAVASKSQNFCSWFGTANLNLRPTICGLRICELGWVHSYAINFQAREPQRVNACGFLYQPFETINFGDAARLAEIGLAACRHRAQGDRG
jgi:hypothetical protein